MEAPNDGLERENERWRLMCEDQRSQLQSLQRELEAEQEARRLYEALALEYERLRNEDEARATQAQAEVERLREAGLAYDEVVSETPRLNGWEATEKWLEDWVPRAEAARKRFRDLLTPKDTEEG